MTEKQAVQATKYFSEGVSARIWCYAGAGQWSIDISRSSHSAWFYDLDSTKRAVQLLYQAVNQSSRDLELWNNSNDYYPEAVIEFSSVSSAADCVSEIQKAIAHIQSVSSETRWHEVPGDLFESFAELHKQQIHA